MLPFRLFNQPTMKLKLCLSFLMFYVVPDVEPASNRWLINVPSKIPAVQGSCVVIPCTYVYPKTNKKLNRRRAFWKTGNKIVSTNLRKWKLTPEFKKRSLFLGNVRGGNCTMMLDGVRTTDVGPFYFRIELPRYKTYTFSENTVTIVVIRSAPPPSLSVEVLDKVTASCSVSHSCRVMPPRLTWSRSGTTTTKTKKLNNWMWKTKSVLTFVPLASDFNKPLNCTVRYRGGKQAESSVLLFI
ncbi:sialic acid-binding Ig-like lectin 14 [Kryptolebias marmoratus]|uniref:sialic acid-binding Ig-like lectin 14 n=1 Tax=Kryptolebias marmoratus TaxID=37003 RepID=UPI0007F8C34C|nr:sialic acid-binding Ig-like lectin 14 [Kryptolebias marmoratus]